MEIRNGYIKEEEMDSPIVDEEVKYVFNKEYKVAKKNQIVFNNELIGEVSKSGEYYVSEKYLSTLVEINKEIVDAGDNRYHVVARSKKYEGFEIKFVITVEGDYLDDKRISSLILLENIKDPIYDKETIVKTHIATYEDDNDAFFFAKVKSIFHLYEKDESEGKEIANDELLAEIMANKIQKRETMKREAGRLDYLSEKYCQDLLVILKRSGKFGEYVMKKLQDIMAELGSKAPQKGDLDYYKKLASFLDKALQMSESYPVPQSIQNQIDNLQKGRAREIDATIMVKENIPGKKVEVKSASAEGGGATKGGSSGKGAASKGATAASVKKASATVGWKYAPHGSDGYKKDAYELTKTKIDSFIAKATENALKNTGKEL